MKNANPRDNSLNHSDAVPRRTVNIDNDSPASKKQVSGLSVKKMKNSRAALAVSGLFSGEGLTAPSHINVQSVLFSPSVPTRVLLSQPT